ncbi:MAG: helix-turn-helix transcriptional regulator [bacterium]|nr:helix-turn-helix transcriptional regulator [bacterium]MDT8395267.1 helix-turn-helix transcriptional regulator [bacterium]
MAKKKTAKAVKILQDRYIGDDPCRKAFLEEERLNAQVARTIYQMRIESGMTQKQLADLIGTTQSVISRLEDGDYEGHSLSMVTRIAEALERKVRVQLVGKGK